MKNRNRPPPFRHSKSSMGVFLTCPRQYFYSRSRDVPKRVDHPRLCGGVIHKVAETLYRPTREPRPFFFKEKGGMIGFFRHLWQKELRKAREQNMLPGPDEDMDQKFRGVGIKCLGNYWDANVSLPRPLEVESVYKHKLWGKYPLIGIFDQVRAVSLPWIERHRPELVVDGKLNGAYDPITIVDLKSEYTSFDPAQSRNRIESLDILKKVIANFSGRRDDLFRLLDGGNEEALQTFLRALEMGRKEEVSPEDEMRGQFELHESIQATLYTLLYLLKRGKKPVAFCWYHLPTNKWFPTWREEPDFDTFYGILDFCHQNIVAQQFPKNVGSHCKKCDFFDFCRGDRTWIVSHPEAPGEGVGETPKILPQLIKSPPTKQLTLKLHTRRVKVEKPLIVAPQTPPVIRHLPMELPWKNDQIPPLPVSSPK